MIKYFCDRCEKEVNNLTNIKIPKEKTGYNGFTVESIHVCSDCKKEFDDINNKLTDIRFVLFSNFMKK